MTENSFEKYKPQKKLYFDDENIEELLYSDNPAGPSSADIYLPLKEKMKEIRSLHESGDIALFKSKIMDLFCAQDNLSSDIYLQIIAWLRKLIPDQIKPILQNDIHDIGLIIERIWFYSLKHDLINQAGVMVQRWYEHNGNYTKAKEVLVIMIDLAIKQKERSNEALYKNNYAFNCLVEKNWKAAIPLFKESSEIFYELNNTFQYVNAMLNHWLCRIELFDSGESIKIEEEINSLEEHIRESLENQMNSSGDYWHRRKPFILRAKIEERKGNYEKAIEYIEYAIKSMKDFKTTYLEEDEKYLAELQKKRDLE